MQSIILLTTRKLGEECQNLHEERLTFTWQIRHRAAIQSPKDRERLIINVRNEQSQCQEKEQERHEQPNDGDVSRRLQTRFNVFVHNFRRINWNFIRQIRRSDLRLRNVRLRNCKEKD
jgi:hypothetical protein